MSIPMLIICYNRYTDIALKGNVSMKPLKEKVSITLDSDVVEKIKNLAEEDERSFSQYINKVLKDYLKSTEK